MARRRSVLRSGCGVICRQAAAGGGALDPRRAPDAQYSSASMMVRTRVVTDGSAGSGDSISISRS